MTTGELKEEISIELDFIESTVQELLSLNRDLADREPSVREKTAAAAFMAQFYNGIENILKRITRFKSVPLPKGDSWHIDLFKQFCEPPYDDLPALFDEHLALNMSAFRKFRHVVHHGYGFQIKWDHMQEGIAIIEDVFSNFRNNLSNYIKTLHDQENR